MKYTETELQQLLKDVEKEFKTQLAKTEEDFKASTGVAGEPLAKAEDKAEDKKDDNKDAEAKPDEKKEETKEAPASEAKPEDKAEDKKEDAAPEQKEAAPAAESKDEAKAPSDEDSCNYDEEDMEHMHKMYSSMSKAELKAHHDSVKKALDSMGMAKCGDMSMSKSETNTSIEQPSIEVKPEDAKPSEELALLKSEVEAQKAKADGLQKNLDAVTEFLTKLVKKTAPQGKAITSYEAIAKSEETEEVKPMSKSEINEILLKKSADPKLTKSDRDAINAFYLNGASTNSINHLLK